MNNRVSVITLGVSSLARSKTFYAKLGWQPAEEQESIVFYQLNGLVLGLFGLDNLAEDQGRAGIELGRGAITLAQNYASPAEVDSAFDRAVVAGATVLKEPKKAFWGGYSGYFADPDGHVWELAFNPFWQLKDDGSVVLGR